MLREFEQPDVSLSPERKELLRKLRSKRNHMEESMRGYFGGLTHEEHENRNNLALYKAGTDVLQKIDAAISVVMHGQEPADNLSYDKIEEAEKRFYSTKISP